MATTERQQATDDATDRCARGITGSQGSEGSEGADAPVHGAQKREEKSAYRRGRHWNAKKREKETGKIEGEVVIPRPIVDNSGRPV